jgi:putative tricarboxylic transport membrane protein
MFSSASKKTVETALGAVFCLVGGGFAYGALDISSDAGYGGVGPNFLPWVVAIALSVCGLGLIWQGLTTGYLERDEPEGAMQGDWIGFAWVSAALLANAVLIQNLGFVLSCTLCFVLAVRGFHYSQGKRSADIQTALKTIALSAFIGLCIAAPVYWMFGMLLGIQLPALTSTGWI